MGAAESARALSSRASKYIMVFLEERAELEEAERPRINIVLNRIEGLKLTFERARFAPQKAEPLVYPAAAHVS